MKFDRKAFFDGVKDRIDPTLNQDQVDGLEFLLEAFENEPRWSDIRKIAYAFATIFHETAGTFQPIHEYGTKDYFNKRYNPNTEVGKSLGNTKAGDGAKYAGRGFVQLTGRKNYARYQMEDSPDDVMAPKVAFKILTDGMFNGTFTGKYLSLYINDKQCDYVAARRIINGQDKAGLIAGYAKSFEKILKVSTAIPPSKSAPNVSDVPAQPSPDPTVGLPSIQNAETIVNSGDIAPPPPPTQDVTMNAPAAMGSVEGSAKVTILGIGVPTCLVAFFKIIGQWFQDGTLDVKAAFNSVVQLIQQNMKYILILAALVVGMIMLKKIERIVVFIVSMITHAMPGWNSVTVTSAVPVTTKPWYQFWK